jgi:hypothetical protein
LNILSFLSGTTTTTFIRRRRLRRRLSRLSRQRLRRVFSLKFFSKKCVYEVKVKVKVVVGFWRFYYDSFTYFFVESSSSS